MKPCLPAIVLCASLLAGCATTDANRGATSAAVGAYDDGYYVAAHDGFGDYYYDRPQVLASYDPWYFGTGFGRYGWYGGYGFGFAPWGFGDPFWFGVPPWYWHHHHHPRGPHTEAVALAHADVRPDARKPEQRPVRAPAPFPDRRDREMRAPRHEIQHSRP